MNKKIQEKITFPRYFAALKVKKLKEYSFDALMLCIQLIGIIGIIFLAYGFLISLDKQFNQDIDPYEQGVEKTDYSPYSGWTYE
jgi:hypothetical protein